MDKPLPPITVRDILDRALPAGTSIVAGEEGLARPVRWVRLFRSLAPALGVEGRDEFILIPVEALYGRWRGQSLAGLLHELHSLELEVAGVAALGEVTPGDQATADLLAIPLLVLPEGTDLRAILRKAISLLSERYLAWEQQAANICQEMSQLANQGRGLAAILELLANRVEKVVAIQDQNLHLYAYATSSTLPLIQEEVAALLEGGSFQGKSLVGESEPSRSNLLCIRHYIKLPDGTASYLSVLGKREEVSDFDRMLMGKVTSICALEMAKEKNW